MTLPGLPPASKNTRRLVRELAAKARERELAVALGHLHDAFAGWRDGSIGAFELNERIHRFHNGPSRDLYNTYSEVDPAMLVAHAVVSGVLSESEIPVEVLEYIEVPLAFYRRR